MQGQLFTAKGFNSSSAMATMVRCEDLEGYRDAAWFLPGEIHSLAFDLLRPYPEEDMQSWRVRDEVGNTKNNWGELIEPIPEDTPTRDKKETSKGPKKKLPPHRLFG